MRQKIKKLILDGVDANIDKNETSKQMNELMSGSAKTYNLTKKDMRVLKDIVHYKGMGWGDSCLEIAPKPKGSPKRHTDKVTPTFKKLVTLIETCRDAGQLDLLSEYFEACTGHGITIQIDTKHHQPKCDDVENLKKTLEALDKMQCVVCQKNDYITQELAEQSETLSFAPKGKYKSVVELATKIKEGKNVDEKIDALLTKNNMHNAALETIIEEQAPTDGLENIKSHSDRVEKALELVNLDGDDFVFDLNEHSNTEAELVEDTLKIVSNNENAKSFLKSKNIEIYKEGKEYIAASARIAHTDLEWLIGKGWYVSLN